MMILHWSSHGSHELMAACGQATRTRANLLLLSWPPLNKLQAVLPAWLKKGKRSGGDLELVGSTYSLKIGPLRRSAHLLSIVKPAVT